MIFKKNNKTLVIAEACDNHFGNLATAKKFVDFAKIAGVDFIKFQHHLPDEEMLPDVPKSKNFDLSLYEFLKKYALNIQQHKKLILYSKKKKIKYLCTPFSYKAALELHEIGVDMFKIGSGEFTDKPFIKKILEFNKPVIFSTGMTSISDIKMMVEFINKNKRNNNIAFLNCTSEYPPIYQDINLNFIPKLKKICKGYAIGHSDHTNDNFTSYGAVTLGAKIIEKHIIIKKKSFGPDRDVSINLQELKDLVEGIRKIEKSLGSQKKIYTLEKPIERWAKRSIVAINNIKKGEKFSESNIWSKRPGTGIPSRFFYKLIGKIAKKNIKKNSLIKKNHFS